MVGARRGGPENSPRRLSEGPPVRPSRGARREGATTSKALETHPSMRPVGEAGGCPFGTREHARRCSEIAGHIPTTNLYTCEHKLQDLDLMRVLQCRKLLFNTNS